MSHATSEKGCWRCWRPHTAYGKAVTKHEASTSTDVAKQWVWLAQARKHTKSPFSHPGLTIAVSGARKEARAFEHCELWWQPAHLTCQPQKKDFTYGLSHKENGTGKENR